MHGTISLGSLKWQPKQAELSVMQRLVLDAAAAVAWIDPEEVRSNIPNGVYRALRIRGLLQVMTSAAGRCGYEITDDGRRAIGQHIVRLEAAE